MGIFERLKNLRKELKLTQSAFGKALGVSIDVIANLEYGRVELKDSMLNLICKTFSVNPLWLTKGEGEMFFDVTEQLVNDLCVAYDLSELEVRILKNYLKLPAPERETALITIQRFFAK